MLAPDAVGFEDRRYTGTGIEQREDDRLQYFNEMAYRLVSGRLLAATVLGDKRRRLDRTGIELSQAIPGILELADVEGLLWLIAPRPLLLLSASEDRYSADAPEVVRASMGAWKARGALEKLEHVRCGGGHALTPDRTEKIISWETEQAHG